MPMYNEVSGARTAYEAYGSMVGGLNYNGDPMPTWVELPMKQKNAWIKAVAAAVDKFNHFLIDSAAM